MSTACFMRGRGCYDTTMTTDPTATTPPKHRWQRWRHWFSRWWRGRCATHPTQRWVELLARKLELNDPQRAALVRLLSELALWRADLFRERTRVGANLRALLAASPLDQTVALERVREATRAMDERAAKLLGVFAEFSDGLHEPQRQRLLAWLDRWLQAR